ncbi:MAG: hypothetical protein ACTSRG_19640 [Candidatus Helarchaeota archaeon]
MTIFSPTNESERRKFYRWNKNGILKKIRVVDKTKSGRPKNFYVFNAEYFKKESIDLIQFLITIKEMKKYIPIALGLPFSLLIYNYLQVSSIYVYTNSENLELVRQVLSDYPFVIIKEASESVFDRMINFHNLPLLSLEDTIISAFKDAQNWMVSYVLLSTQSNKINHSRLIQELISNEIDMQVFMPLLKKQDARFSSCFPQDSNVNELKAIEKASKNLLRNNYNWDDAFSLLRDKFEFINKI